MTALTQNHFELLADYLTTVVWFLVCVLAKLSHINQRKKLTTGKIWMIVFSGVVGGVFAYYGTVKFSKEFRAISMGLGVLAGDILITWVLDNARGKLDTFGAWLESWIKRKK